MTQGREFRTSLQSRTERRKVGAQSNVNDGMSDYANYDNNHATPWTRGAAIWWGTGEMGIESRCLDEISIDSSEKKKKKRDKTKKKNVK